jgi:isocitrate dehydrogenase (NAD+)
MTYSVTLIPGDGTGPELVTATRRVLEATGVRFDWVVRHAGAAAVEQSGTPMPEEVLEAIRATKVALKGPITTPLAGGFRSVNVALWRALDLYANVRLARSMTGIPACHDHVDLVVVRENTEDLYAGIEHEVIPDLAAESVRVITRPATERIVRFAFEYARANGRGLVTAVHKANILKATDGLFLRVAGETAADYPDIEFNDRIIDNMCMQLVQRPHEYEVLVCPNLFGDIISDLCSGLVGGLGVTPGMSLGRDIAVFEPGHGSAPKYTGQNKVNPTASILSGALMLRHLGEFQAAERVEVAVAQVIAAGRYVTYDLKAERNDPSAVGTQKMADAIISTMQQAGSGPRRRACTSPEGRPPDPGPGEAAGR